MKKTVALILSILLMIAIAIPVGAFSSVPVKSIALGNAKVIIKVGETYKLKATLSPANTTQKLLSYSTENKNIATVDKAGKITAVKAGTTVVTVSSTSNNKVLAKCDVYITKTAKLKTLMFQQYYNDAGFKAVLKDLTAETGITLDITQVPNGEQGNVIFRTRFATKDFPDLMFYYSGNISQDLNKPGEVLLDQTNADWTKNYDKEMWKISQSCNGIFYAAPYDGGLVLGTLYNKKVFSSLGIKIPKTYAEFTAACEKIKAAGKTPFYISGKDGWTTMLPAWLAGSYGFTTDYIDKVNTNKIKFKDNALVKSSLVKLLEIKNKGYANKDYLSATWDNAQKALANGDCAMYINLTNTMDGIVQKYPDKADDIGFFAFPFVGGGKDYVGVTGTNGLYAFKGKNQVDAQRFINYFESINVQNKFFGAQGGIPAIKGVTNMKLSKAEKEAKAVVDSGKGNIMWSTGLKYGFGDYGGLCVDLLTGAKTPDQVLESVDNEFQKNAKSKADPNFK